jgi:hypothetical protein
MLRTPAASSAATPILMSSLASIPGSAGKILSAPILLAHTRGAETVQQISTTPQSQLIALKILPAEASNTYGATLEQLTDSGSAIPVANIEASADSAGYVTLYVDSSQLKAGTYRLSLSAPAGDEPFVFRVSTAN